MLLDAAGPTGFLVRSDDVLVDTLEKAWIWLIAGLVIFACVVVATSDVEGRFRRRTIRSAVFAFLFAFVPFGVHDNGAFFTIWTVLLYQINKGWSHFVQFFWIWSSLMVILTAYRVVADHGRTVLRTTKLDRSRNKRD